MKKTNTVKSIIIASVSLVLVAAIACGAIFIPKWVKKGDDEVLSTTMVVDQKAPSDGSTPQGEVLDAALESFFEDGDMSLELAGGKITINIDTELGENIEDSKLLLEISVLGQVTSYSFENAQVTVNKPGRSEKVYDIEEFADMEDWNEIFEELGIDATMIDVLNEVISGGKLDRDAVAKLYDGTILPVLEKILEEESGIDVTLPTFENSIAYVEDFINSGISEKALSFKSTDDGNGTVTYKGSFDSEQLVADLFAYFQADDDLNSVLDALSEILTGGTQEELRENFDGLVDIVPGGEISITISGGEVESVVVSPKGYDTYTFTIGGAKA